MQSLRIKKLTAFIKKFRDCKDVDDERKLVQNKLNKIRMTFQKGTNGTTLKRYFWIMVFLNQAGYKCEFGQTQVLQLMASNVYSEKYTGYNSINQLFSAGEITLFEKASKIA